MTRVRFAPAPTGFLHIGGARTYIFNWLFARKEGGQVVLRIDDTDIERSTGESLESILDGLTWLELPWDEKHHQSDRRVMHGQAAEALLAKGNAYRDFTPEHGAEGESEAQSGAPWLCNPAMREMPREESVEQQVRDFSTESNVKAGLIINASRAALTGQPVGPSAFAIFAVLGNECVVERLRRV
jgi:glutamyl-tRNA synthetase